jgi:hypothetical protein
LVHQLTSKKKFIIKEDFVIFRTNFFVDSLVQIEVMIRAAHVVDLNLQWLEEILVRHLKNEAEI